MWRTRLIRKPSQPGTKRLVEQLGSQLVCMLFRCDKRSHERFWVLALISVVLVLLTSCRSVSGEIERLRSSDVKERIEAAENLGKMGEHAAPAVPHLIKMLGDCELYKYVRGRRYRIVEYRSPCGTAKVALGKIGKPVVEPLIAALIKNANSSNEKAAQLAINGAILEILVKDIGGTAITRLTIALKGESERVKKIVWEALPRITDYQARDPLVEPLIAILAEPLIATIKDDHSDIALRKSAIISLGKIKYCRGVETLIGMLKVKGEGERELRLSASEALKNLTEHIDLFYEEWQRWWKQNKQNVSCY